MANPHNESQEPEQQHQEENGTCVPCPLCEQKNAQIVDLTLTLQRLQADFENYKKRNDKEKVEFTKLAERRLVTELLGVLDNFELALQNRSSESVQELLKGIEMIYAQLHDILQKRGLTALETVGVKFDPYKHQALMEEVSSEEPGTILDEFQKGYMLHDTLIRHAKVKVSKKEVQHESSQERVHHETNTAIKDQGNRNRS